jgi:hypothetical protein
MSNVRIAVAASIVAVAALASSARPADEARPVLTETTYAEIRDRVLPTADELAFQKLGWRSTLWQAVVEARAAGKPVLLWAMNGHPLGCT